jgi:hypothetical protein
VSKKLSSSAPSPARATVASMAAELFFIMPLLRIVLGRVLIL